MQTAETAYPWKNRQFNSNEPHNQSTRGAMADTPYLCCSAYSACRRDQLTEAVYFCPQCKSLQCSKCEREIHRQTSNMNLHQRLKIDDLDDEPCSMNCQRQGTIYCLQCMATFCQKCFRKQHEKSDKREHKAVQCSQDLLLTGEKHCDKRTMTVRSTFKSINVNTSDNEIESSQNQLPKHNNINHKMLAESLMDAVNDESIDMTSEQTQDDEHSAFTLIDGSERLTVTNKYEFIQQLKARDKDPSVKCVSIIGNTGDGKSYTLNQIFFDGRDVFRTSAASNSCTMGVWSTLDDNQRTLILDTEGLLGQTTNANARSRLLLKVMCISDIIIYRIRAQRLTNDMFQFLSDASNAFAKYFKNELENVMKNCGMNGSKSLPGPTLIVFHETQYTDVLQDDITNQKTPVQQLKERFDTMNLSYASYHSISYVGVRTNGGETTNFETLRSEVTSILHDNDLRSARPLSVIFKALKALNEKFIHKIPPDVPSTLPDEFFACCFQCLSCESRCTVAANHQKDNLPHQCNKKCTYNLDFDNEIWKCSQCNHDGRDTTVYGKLITKNDGLFQGLMKYVWSGFVIECPKHGEIYRSRKFWYGNSEPKEVTQSEIVHVWKDEKVARAASDVTPRKCMEMLAMAGSYLSAPTKILKETLADQVAPSYWVPNKDAPTCKLCHLKFGSDFSKHHCRSCGQVFCDTCSKNRRAVSWVHPVTPVRVCNTCFGTKDLHPPPSVSNSAMENNQGTRSHERENNRSTNSATVEMPMPRIAYETLVNGLEMINANYPIELLKESTRPNYWQPDHKCKACFICNTEFNNTTNRLHHCRGCGYGVCEKCSPRKRPVPERDWQTPVRVCNRCYDESVDNLTSEQDSNIERK